LPIADCRLLNRRHAKRTFRGIASFVLLCAELFTTGCSKDRSKENGGGESNAITRTASDGPVTLQMSLRPVDVQVSKRARLEIRATADEKTPVQLAEYEKSEELQAHRFEFRIYPAGQPQVQEKDGKREWIQRYNVDFYLPGDYEFPPAKITYTPNGETSDARKSAESQDSKPKEDASPREVKTESIKVTVRAGGAKELTPEELAKVQMPGPVELKKPFDWRIPVAAIVSLTIAVWIMRMWQRHRIAAAERVIIVPPYDWAKQEFARLLGEGFLEKRLFKDFYYRVSGIVRGYIERRFALAAPEMTTEEFLTETADDPRFAGESQWEFRRFLDACDMVKYAKYAPQDAEAQAVLRTAMEFVERTRPSEESKPERELASC